MTRRFNTIFLVAVLFTSCKHQNDDARLNLLLTGLQRTDTIIQESVNAINMSFEERSKDPRYEYRITTWYPKVKLITSLSANMYSFIDSLNEQLVEKKLGKEELEDILFEKLFQYKNDIVNVFNPEEFPDNKPLCAELLRAKKSLYQEIPLLATIKDINERQVGDSLKNNWFEMHFDNASPLMCRAILAKIKSDILISQHAVLQYCNRRTSIHYDSFDVIQAIAMLNSTCIRQGESMIVTAGLGAFSAHRRPKIKIDGKEIGLTAEAVAEYTFIPNGKPGKYSIPVQFEYIENDGEKSTIKKNIHYTILP